MSFALGAIDAECNAGTPSYHLGLQLTCIGNLQSDQMLIISIYTNYDLRMDTLTSEDAVERLQKALDLMEPESADDASEEDVSRRRDVKGTLRSDITAIYKCEQG